MEDLYNLILSLCEKKGVSGGKMCRDIGVSRSFMTELKMGRAKSITLATAKKLAEYFDCDLQVFLSGMASSNEEKEISKEQLKFALFNGDKEITDDMLNEVLNFAEWVRQRENNKENN